MTDITNQLQHTLPQSFDSSFRILLSKVLKRAEDRGREKTRGKGSGPVEVHQDCKCLMMIAVGISGSISAVSDRHSGSCLSLSL